MEARRDKFNRIIMGKINGNLKESAKNIKALTRLELVDIIKYSFIELDEKEAGSFLDFIEKALLGDFE